YQVGAVTVTPDGRLLIGEYGAVRMVGASGRIRTIAGTGTLGGSGDGGFANAAQVGHVHGVAVGPDGTVFVNDHDNEHIRAVRPILPGASLDDITLPSPDGNEVYRFDHAGRHLETVDALTGAVT